MTRSTASALVAVGCLAMLGVVGCSSTVKGSGISANGASALPSSDAVPGGASSDAALPSTDALPGSDSSPGALPSTVASPSADAPGNGAGPGSISTSQPGATAPSTVVITTTATTRAATGHSATTAPSPSAKAAAFQTLTLKTGAPACGATGVTTEPEILTWQVANATGIAVGIDDPNFGDASRYAGASGSQELTNIQCMGSVKYTFDIWTTGGAGARAHQQLQVTGPAGTQLPTPAPTPFFQQLSLSSGTPGCAPQAGRTTVPEILSWRVANATGVAVGIDDPNFGDATQYSGASGSQAITNIACSGSVTYTIDVWTTDGSGGAQAHRQLSVTGPA